MQGIIGTILNSMKNVNSFSAYNQTEKHICLVFQKMFMFIIDFMVNKSREKPYLATSMWLDFTMNLITNLDEIFTWQDAQEKNT